MTNKYYNYTRQFSDEGIVGRGVPLDRELDKIALVFDGLQSAVDRRFYTEEVVDLTNLTSLFKDADQVITTPSEFPTYEADDYCANIALEPGHVYYLNANLAVYGSAANQNLYIVPYIDYSIP